jgi:cyclophilin family peptidyl-prolyl cis-trans isomerase
MNTTIGRNAASRKPAVPLARALFVAGFLSYIVTGLAQVPPPPPGGYCTNCPPYTNAPFVLSPDDSTIDLNIQYVGTMRLALYDRDKPATVKNFLNYVLSGAYSNNFIHYDATNFVCQGGSLKVISFGSSGQAVVPVAENVPITNELNTGSFFSNVRGTIAMAHYFGQPTNTTCDWFINLADNTNLDAPDTNHAYVVFGHVISGLTNLDRLNPTSTNTIIKLVNLGGWLSSCPVNYSANPATITYSNLLMVTYNLVTMDLGLKVQQVATNTVLLSWQSISNRIHTVSFKPDLTSPSWTTLWTTNGNGSTQTFQHVTNSVDGFYRVSFQP